MDFQDANAAVLIRPIDKYLTVESARAQQGRVENFRPIGSRQKHNALLRIKSVEFTEKLVKGLFLFVVSTGQAAGATGATNGVHLVDENDTGRGFSRLLKQVVYERRADANEHSNKLGSVDGEKRHVRLSGHGPGQQGLTGARRTHQ